MSKTGAGLTSPLPAGKIPANGRYLMKKVLLSLGLVATALPAFGALPPYSQRVVELQRILSDNQVRTLLTDRTTAPGSSGVIDELRKLDRTSTGVRYEVVSGTCRLGVTAVYDPSPGGLIGPQRFH